MQIQLVITDDTGREFDRFPAGAWEPHGPNGISLGPGGTVIRNITLPAGRYAFTVEGLTAPDDTEATGCRDCAHPLGDCICEYLGVTGPEKSRVCQCGLAIKDCLKVECDMGD